MTQILSFVLFFILSIIPKNFTQTNDSLSSEDVCMTDSCKKAGADIIASIDPSINPCDDFYEFSCGQWRKGNPIPEDKANYDRLSKMTSKLQSIMQIEMNKTSSPSDSLPVRYAMDFYKTCSDEGALEKRGNFPLLNILYRLGGWPLLGNRSVFNETRFNWKIAIANIYAIVGEPAIFGTVIGPDANQTDFNILFLGVPEFGLGRNQLVDQGNNKDVVNAYKKYILQSTLLLGGEESVQTLQDVDDMISFESELARVSTKPEDMRDSKVWYNKMTFNQLNNLTNNRLNWLKFTQNIFGYYSNIKFKGEDQLIVQDINYYKGAALLMTNTPKRVIANYIGWVTIRKLGAFTTQKFRDIEFEFEKVNSGVQKARPLWKYCINSLESYLSLAYSRKYIDNHFESTAKDGANNIVKYLRKSMKIILRDNEWLDEVTRMKAIEKLNAVSENVAYPEWMLDNNELNNFYNLTKTCDQKKAFESLLYLRTKSLSNMFKKTYQKVNKTLEWPAYPAMVNAFYEWTQNSIVLPAGILTEPFFRNQAPAYMNFGAIGQVIGHEFTHGFDDQGSQFDKDGNLHNWWTDCMKTIFKDKTKCFINRFNEIIVPELNITLNGRNTVGEDMSDAGGLKMAFKAYKLYEKVMGRPQTLPYVQNYSPEQLFFMSFANILCANIRPESLKNQIQYDPHTPNKYRVNAQVTKFSEFTKAFNCGLGTNMNSGYTCDLW